mmetsp:Transcript_1518/g.2064  ORF Transcript_1518/g.2064 Transcript_1518/m.2064 type:complete len:335 (-) Transcript_1518:238-1242(-)|eukprot:CAMPEP_0178894556 /NCGR_PEP_ID=MMETSP0786-20121207/84_1 /TAXON_ID=186022 /ORGANISM="Thalassionema frauenfeldii, Strain CCMP 1798" /LENGTH=334 /DNA_ID=CAMNT_0020564663 /DNA_START=72 /DNA_END=1076 /DNA_ORIENTATION=+
MASHEGNGHDRERPIPDLHSSNGGLRRIHSNGEHRRINSFVLLPAVRIDNRWAIPLTIALCFVIIFTMEQLRTFVIEERALLTQIGRERHRTRRRQFRKIRHCDEADEPKPWQPFSSWRRLSSCVEYDLSLRRTALGDNGVWRLVGHLGRKEYATKHRKGQLRVLNLERQQITRQGAGYLARWLSTDPIETEDNDVVDVDRIPTAASRSLFINLEGNPIGPLGVKQLERAVDKAKLNGISVVIVGGGNSADVPAGGKADHVVKLGPIVYTRKSIDMPPWRLPVPFTQKVVKAAKNNSVLPIVQALLIFVVGLAIGRTSSFITFPYSFALVRNDE